MLKVHVQQIIDESPDDVDVESFAEKLLLLRRLERAERALDQGQGISHEDIRREFQVWIE